MPLDVLNSISREANVPAISFPTVWSDKEQLEEIWRAMMIVEEKPLIWPYGY